MAVIKEEKLEEGKRVSRVATPPEGGWGWMIVAGCFLANLCTRAVTRCVSMFFVEFQLHFNKDYSTTSWIHSLVDSMTMLCAPLGGFLGTRLSIRATIMIGGLLSSTGLVLSSFATSLEYLYATMGIMTGLGFALSYTTSIAMVGMYFEQRKALAYGIALSGSGIGTFILAPVVQLLIENYSWRGALLVMGGFVSHLCVCGAVMRPVELRGGDKMSEDEKENLEKDSMDTVLDSKGSEEPSESKLDINHLNYTEGLLIANGALKNCEQGNVALLPNQPDSRLTDTAECILFSNKLNATISGDNKLSDPQLANGSTIEDTKTEDSGFSEADSADASPKGPCCSVSWKEYSFLLTPNFLIFCASCLFMAYGCSAPVVYLVPYAIFQGVEQKHAAFLMSIFGVCGIVGNITFGWITDTQLLKKYRLVCYMVAVGMEGLCCLVLPLLNTFPLLVMFSVVYGYFDGAYVALIPVVASDVVDPSCLTPALGVVYFLHAIPFLISPPIGGWLVDTTGNYTATFFLCGACFIFSAFILGASMLARCCRRSKSISDTVVSPKHIVAAAQRGIM